MTEHEADMKGLRREWAAARILALIGVLLLVAVGAYFAINPPNSLAPASSENPTVAAQRSAAAVALCSAALATTQGFGIVPAYTRLASDMVQEGALHGRYTCFAQTDAAKYQVTFDLMCKDLSDAKCINLYSVVQDGTGPIYQRH